MKIIDRVVGKCEWSYRDNVYDGCFWREKVERVFKDNGRDTKTRMG